ncbi:MAG: PQQ-dependent sugar dehydrogenase [Myxococcales bacterium]|nr:PQQ-dependent sugar dehydrogenase [Myxococcales bacterium]MDH3484887.1 PQQ-dependent sugar dehydrogenase [Myxococcales bacterium]
MQKIGSGFSWLLTISCLIIAGCGDSSGCSDCGTGGSGATGGSGGGAGTGGNVGGRVTGLEYTTVISGLDKPWDIAWLPNGTVLVTERPGRLNIYGNGIDQAPSLVIEPDDVVASGEGGMLGLEVDPSFESNGYVYVCFCSNAGGANPEYVPDVRLVRYTLTTPNGDSVVRRDEIVTDMPYTSGRHSGCRPRFGLDGYLWVGTGDAAYRGDPTAPQDDNSLGGKVLRIDRNGDAAPGNVVGLWFSKGHRNIQGMAFRTADDLGMSAEHGPDTDDEINLLVRGNFGWDPGVGYIESVPMTDTDKFPEAIEAAFSTGRPTLAYSGAAFIEGDQWANWDGVLAVATLKAEHLHIYFVDAEGTTTDGGRYIEDEGRLRSPRMGPDGLLYVTTDGGGGSGEVLQVSPVVTPEGN